MIWHKIVCQSQQLIFLKNLLLFRIIIQNIIGLNLAANLCVCLFCRINLVQFNHLFITLKITSFLKPKLTRSIYFCLSVNFSIYLSICFSIFLFVCLSYCLIFWTSKSIEMVTSKGELVKVNKEENPELFWGMKFYGTNFGYEVIVIFVLLCKTVPDTWSIFAGNGPVLR